MQPKNITLIAEDEIFKKITYKGIDFENYLISNYGRLYSLNHNMILSLRYNNTGYVRYRLHRNGKCHYISGHRLVATAFIKNPKPKKYNQVNHKDENPINNKWTNLEWCDCKYNLNYGTAQERRAAKRSKKVIQINTKNEIVKEYISLNEASRQTDLGLTQLWKSCHNGNMYNDYYWRYAEAC